MIVSSVQGRRGRGLCTPLTATSSKDSFLKQLVPDFLVRANVPTMDQISIKTPNLNVVFTGV
jgi:hypothetical protein